MFPTIVNTTRIKAMSLKTHKIYSKAEAEASDLSPYQEKNLNAAEPNLGSSKLIDNVF